MLKSQYQKVKGFVVRHKEALVVTLVTGTVIALQYDALREMNKFLADKELLGEFYRDRYVNKIEDQLKELDQA